MGTKFPAVIAVLALSACGSSLPDSNPNAGGGVGFSDYEAYQSNQVRSRELAIQRAQRDAQLEAPITAALPEERAIAQDTLGVLNSTQTASVAPSNPGISDEQSFDAVSARQTIESDRQRLDQQSASMQVAAPEAVPTRPNGPTAPNVVAYALSTTNGVGQSVHSRSSRFNQDRYRAACAGFASSDQAQAAFLAAGGPEKDRRGLDPDGDGFACFWDPRPFRTARGG